MTNDWAGWSRGDGRDIAVGLKDARRRREAVDWCKQKFPSDGVISSYSDVCFHGFGPEVVVFFFKDPVVAVEFKLVFG